MSFIIPSVMSIAILDPGGSGTPISTFYLPPPDVETGITLEWVEKSFTTSLIDGSESVRRLGFIPELVCSWKVFDDVNARYGYPLGNTSGCQLTMAGLLSVLDTTPGFVKICPSVSQGLGFVCQKMTVAPIGIIGPTGLASGLTITFRGGNICSTKTMGAY